VLNYHGANIAGADYASNDHAALQEDLDRLTDAGWRVAPLPELVRTCVLGRSAPAPKTLALTFDDGTDFDFVDLVHPVHGPQRSLYNILRGHGSRAGLRQPSLHATAFVVVSPADRAELDRRSMIGAGWWNDDWWQPAIASGLMGIANHSWDHNHPLSTGSPADGRRRGTFDSIADFARAEGEIARAADHLRRVAANPAQSLFAYPYGDANAYLAEEYFPVHGIRIGVDAAFTSAGLPITESSERWRLPRYTCGQHWTTPGELDALLRDIER
jgi:peptidoglycan/xylan/chitin deacetylase (PgdA/CDA1 family)